MKLVAYLTTILTLSLVLSLTIAGCKREESKSTTSGQRDGGTMGKSSRTGHDGGTMNEGVTPGARDSGTMDHQGGAAATPGAQGGAQPSPGASSAQPSPGAHQDGGTSATGAPTTQRSQ